MKTLAHLFFAAKWALLICVFATVALRDLISNGTKPGDAAKDDSLRTWCQTHQRALRTVSHVLALSAILFALESKPLYAGVSAEVVYALTPQGTVSAAVEFATEPDFAQCGSLGYGPISLGNGDGEFIEPCHWFAYGFASGQYEGRFATATWIFKNVVHRGVNRMWADTFESIASENGL